MIYLSIARMEYVSGHNFETVEGTPDNVHILKCKTCDHFSIAWSHNPIEDQK